MARSGAFIGRQRGLTFGELLTTLAIAGISLSLAVPGFNSIVNNNRRITSVNKMVTTMHTARSEAITRNGWIMVCPSTDGNACNGTAWSDGWLYFFDGDRDRVLDAGEIILGSAPEMNRIDIDSAEFPSYFLYRPNGRIMGALVANNTGQFTFCDPRGADHARVVVISMSGQPTLSETQYDGSAPTC